MKLRYVKVLIFLLYQQLLNVAAQEEKSPSDDVPTTKWSPPLLKPITLEDALPSISDVNNIRNTTSNNIESESIQTETVTTTTENPKLLDAEYRLINKWRAEHNTVRPRRRFYDTVNVKMGFGLFKISQIQEDLHMAVLHGWTMMIWNDDYHSWNTSDYGGLEAVSVSPDLIWKPDIVQYSASTRDKTVNIFGNMNVNIFSSGRILWAPSTTIAVQMEPENDTSWPHDQHHITFKLGTWSHGTSAVNLIPADATLLSGGVADTSQYVEGPRWSLLNFTGREQKETFKCCPGARISMMTFDLDIERKPNFLFHFIGWPLKLVLFSSCALFTFPIAAISFRLLFCGIYFMVYSVLLLVLQQILPHGSIYSTNVPLPAAAVVSAIALLLADVCAVVLIGALAKVNKYRFPSGWTATVLHAVARGMLLDPHRSVVHDNDAIALYHRMSDDTLAVAIAPPLQQQNGSAAAAANNGASNGTASPWNPHNYNNNNATTLPAGVTFNTDAVKSSQNSANDWRLLAAVLNRFALIVNIILCIVITVATP